MRVLSFLALGAVATASSLDVCRELHSRYPDYVAWDPLSAQALKSAGNAPMYATARTEYWNGVNANNRPTCAFFPANAEHVSAAVKQLNDYPNARFALKSGGHNFNVGISSTDNGVLISFNENMSSVRRSDDGKSFEVGAGARWGDVYKVGAETNQIAVGGRLSNLGVAGFTLGGGLSYYSAQYGLTCDNVINFEVVLGNGTITNANSTSNPDLWWAMKGGGNRFAILTKLTVKAHPAGVDGKVWGGIRFYPADVRQDVFKAVSEFVRDYPDPKAAVIPTFDFGLPGSIVSNPAFFFFYDGPTPPQGAFGNLDSIKPLIDTTNTTTYPELADQAGGGKIYGINAAARVNTFPNMEPEKTARLFEDHWDLYKSQIKNDSSRNLDIQIGTFTTQPISVQIAKASQANGGNALGLHPDNGDRIWVENDLIWVNPVCNDACPAHLKEVADGVRDKFEDQFKGTPPTNYKSGDVEFVGQNPLFMNDAADYQDVYSSYGEDHKARLQKIAKAYDPNGFMSRQGGWQLWT